MEISVVNSELVKSVFWTSSDKSDPVQWFKKKSSYGLITRWIRETNANGFENTSGLSFLLEKNSIASSRQDLIDVITRLD